MGATRPHHSVLSRDDCFPKNIDQKAVASFMAGGKGETLILGLICGCKPETRMLYPGRQGLFAGSARAGVRGVGRWRAGW